MTDPLPTEITPPARKEFLPFCLPDIGEEEIEEVAQVLRSGWITTGPRTREFERRLGEYVGARHAIAVNSCTAALHIALAALGIGPGDEVVTSPMTFCSTVNVIVHLGGTPVFADIGSDYNIDPAEIERRITPRTRAIIPVHYSGQPCRMDDILACARDHGLRVVEDAAHAIGASYHGRMVGAIGDITAFSFYATKNLTTAEGGMITTDDDDLAERMRLLALHGISKDAWKRYTSEGSWYYEVIYAGYKYNMTDIQAALGIHQLARLEQFLEARRQIVARYNDAFSEMPELQTPVVHDDLCHAWHLYVIQLNLERLTINRAQFIEALRAENIGTSVHFIPVHLHPYYRERYGFKPGDYPMTERIYERILSLPLYPKMSEQDIRDVIAAVTRIVQTHRR
ncbi:MAG: DegT/DnrJ/EryC1/StrS family aminotransferase [Anaerolineae bacterium]